MDALRTLTVTFYARYPSLSAGEFLDEVTVTLLPGLPAKLGPLGPALKFLPPGLADIKVRWAVTRAVAPWDATITDVAPGSYRMHLLEDHGTAVTHLDDPQEVLGPALAGGGVGGLLVGSLPACDQVTGAALGPLTLPGTTSTCITKDSFIAAYGTDLGATFDPQRRLCKAFAVNAAGESVTMYVYCGGTTLRGSSGVFSRTLHLPVAGDFERCGIELPPEGHTALEAIIRAAQGTACTTSVTTTVPPASGWTWKAHADGCGSSDTTTDPENPNSDSVTATYKGSVALGSTGPAASLPVTLLKYSFAVPRPNRDLDLTVSFAYHLDNAQLVLYVQAGDATPNSVSAALIASDPRLTTSPDLNEKGQTGTVSWHTTLLSAGATQGTLYFLVVPTTWVTTPLASARFELCNVGLREKSFAKLTWTDPVTDTDGVTQVQAIGATVTLGTAATSDLLAQVTPGVCRARKAWIIDPLQPDYRSFRTLGTECEEIWLGFEVPKNDNTTDSKNHVVMSGTPTRLRDVASGSLTGPKLTSAMAAIGIGAKLYDPVRLVNRTGCEPDPLDPTKPASLDPLCLAEYEGRVLLKLPRITTNGRFYATLPIRDADIRLTTTTGTRGSIVPVIAQGAAAPAFPYLRCTGLPSTSCAYYNNQLDANGIPLESGYVPRPPVGTFYQPEVHPELNGFSSDVSTGEVSVAQDGSGTGSTITITLRPPAGGIHTVQANLNCITIDGGVPICKP